MSVSLSRVHVSPRQSTSPPRGTETETWVRTTILSCHASCNGPAGNTISWRNDERGRLGRLRRLRRRLRNCLVRTLLQETRLDYVDVIDAHSKISKIQNDQQAF